MSYYPNEKRGWKKAKEDIDRYNQKEEDTINDPNADPWVRNCLHLGKELSKIEVKKFKKK